MLSSLLPCTDDDAFIYYRHYDRDMNILTTFEYFADITRRWRERHAVRGGNRAPSRFFAAAPCRCFLPFGFSGALFLPLFFCFSVFAAVTHIQHDRRYFIYHYHEAAAFHAKCLSSTYVPLYRQELFAAAFFLTRRRRRGITHDTRRAFTLR